MKIFITGSVDIESSAYIVSLSKDEGRYIATITLDWAYKKIYLQDHNNKVNISIDVNNPVYIFDGFPSETKANFKLIRAEITTKLQHPSTPFQYFRLNRRNQIESRNREIRVVLQTHQNSVAHYHQRQR